MLKGAYLRPITNTFFQHVFCVHLIVALTQVVKVSYKVHSLKR